jgi:translation initiation factor IF-2
MGLIVNSLKQNKKNINMVREDEECGMIIENFDNYKEGDILEAYDVDEKFENITKTNRVIQCYVE